MVLFVLSCHQNDTKCQLKVPKCRLKKRQIGLTGHWGGVMSQRTESWDSSVSKEAALCRMRSM